ncbi:MAG: hypothetical protein M0Q95_19315, partial [Porticoccaceae bacterium]|nr:hypothetical protein [Porticoccaceae bacterium]
DDLHGGDGNDQISGGEGADSLFGDSGNDLLYGENGDDTLDGGAGNDTLNGGTGNNSYRFGWGDGQDVIYHVYDPSAGKRNVLQFKDDVTPNDVLVSRLNNDLVLSLAGTTDKVTVYFFFYQDNPGNDHNPLQEVVFADGTRWDQTALIEKAMTGTDGADTLRGLGGADSLFGGGSNDYIYGQGGDDDLHGGDGNDQISGGEGADSLFGDSGNDLLYGDNGDDTLDGGAGNDTLNGGTGNNSYRFGWGDGQDVIYHVYDPSAGKRNVLQFKDDVTPNDVLVSRLNNDLVLSLAGTTDKVTVYFFFYQDNPGNEHNPLQAVVFTDGTRWDQAALIEKAMTGTDAADILRGLGGDDSLFGDSGNDILYGENGDDTLDGGAGNDSLNGGDGSDTYLFVGNFGADHISNYDAVSASIDAAFFEGRAIEDLWFSQSGSSLKIFVVGTDNSVTVNNWYSGASYQLDRIETDAWFIEAEDVQLLVSAMAGYQVPSGVEGSLTPEMIGILQPAWDEAWQLL